MYNKDRQLRLASNIFDFEDFNSDLKTNTSNKKSDLLFQLNSKNKINKYQLGQKQKQWKWSKKPSLKNYHCKTEAESQYPLQSGSVSTTHMYIQQPQTMQMKPRKPFKNLFQLPQISISKNPLIQMKFNQIQRSQIIIRNSNKNTKILNQIIQILTDNPQKTDKQSQKKQSINSKKAIKGSSMIQKMKNDLNKNEFLENSKREEGPTFKRAPKIINPQFIKLCDQKLIERRNIYSQERCRPGMKHKKPIHSHKKSSNASVNVQDYLAKNSHNKHQQSNQYYKIREEQKATPVGEQSINMLTFYKPSYTPSSNKNLLKVNKNCHTEERVNKHQQCEQKNKYNQNLGIKQRKSFTKCIKGNEQGKNNKCIETTHQQFIIQPYTNI